MTHRFAVLLTFCFGVLCCSAAPAQAQSDYHKWEISPFAGYETGGSFPVSNTNTPFVYDKLRASGGLSAGSFVGYSLFDNFQVEMMWNHNGTTFDERNIDGSYSKAFDSTTDQFLFGISYMFRGPDKKLRPYAGGGVGFTHLSNGQGTPNQTNFAFGLGGGVKYMFTRHLGFRADARWLPTYENSSPGTYCDPFGYCYVANVPNYLHRGNFTVGLVVKF